MKNPFKQEKVAIGDLGVLHFITTTEEGIVVFEVLARKDIRFDYWRGTDLSVTGVDPGTTADPIRLGGTFLGRTISDLLYHDNVDFLLHHQIDWHPKTTECMPWWVAGYLQADYHNILTATKEAPFGYLVPPINLISIPKVHLEFSFRNTDLNLADTPLIGWTTAVDRVKYIVDPDLIEAILRRKLRVPWFLIYGYKAFDYDFRASMRIPSAIPLDATTDAIKKWCEQTRALGKWVR